MLPVKTDQEQSLPEKPLSISISMLNGSSSKVAVIVGANLNKRAGGQRAQPPPSPIFFGNELFIVKVFF